MVSISDHPSANSKLPHDDVLGTLIKLIRCLVDPLCRFVDPLCCLVNPLCCFVYPLRCFFCRHGVSIDALL